MELEVMKKLFGTLAVGALVGIPKVAIVTGVKMPQQQTKLKRRDFSVDSLPREDIVNKDSRVRYQLSAMPAKITKKVSLSAGWS